MGSDFQKEYGKLIDRSVPLSAFLQPDDVARAILFASLPRQSVVAEITLEPSRDVQRMSVYTEKQAIEAMLASPSPYPSFSTSPPSPTALVTGAGRGIGRAIAIDLARRGFRLALIARTLSDLEEVGAACKAVRGDVRLMLFPINVCNRAALAEAVECAASEGSLAVVVSNAGTNRRRSVATADIRVWEEVVDTNLLSAMHLTRCAMPHLLRYAQATPAHVIFINSSLALERTQPFPGVAPYATSKAGLAAFAKVCKSV